MIRVIITDHSEWNFDYDTMMYMRTSREGAASRIAYTDEWEPFEELEEMTDAFGPKVCVHRPVPWGTGARRMTGVIISDTGIPE